MRRDQRTAKVGTGKKIGGGDQDLRARRADRRHVGALDVAPVADVIADHELGGLRADALDPEVGRKQRDVGALQLRDLDDRPHALHRLHDRGEQRPAHADREIDARRLVPRRVHIVDHVDAADEGDVPVDVA